jgi:hypothetical protein
MARATTIMMAVIKRSNIIFLSWSQTLSLQRLQDLRFRARVLLKDAKLTAGGAGGNRTLNSRFALARTFRAARHPRAATETGRPGIFRCGPLPP